MSHDTSFTDEIVARHQDEIAALPTNPNLAVLLMVASRQANELATHARSMEKQLRSMEKQLKAVWRN